MAAAGKHSTLAREFGWGYPWAMSARFAYYDREADIAWLPTGDSSDVVSEEVDWGLIDHDSATDEVVAIEVWSASERLPATVLEALPAPGAAHGAAA